MEFVTQVVRGHDIQEQYVFGFRIQTWDAKLHLRKHLPVNERGLFVVIISWFLSRCQALSSDSFCTTNHFLFVFFARDGHNNNFSFIKHAARAQILMNFSISRQAKAREPTADAFNTHLSERWMEKVKGFREENT